MATDGIEAVFLTTHNWGKSAKFFQALGFELEFETDHNSGQFRHRLGPTVFIAEVPGDQRPDAQLVLKVNDADGFEAEPIIDVIDPFAATHFGTQMATIRDPDGRIWSLQAPSRSTSPEDTPPTT
ncbi:VOC family protein [Conexibacter arvalis]|uniref:Glyoxalase n=1 Tax=Conexibacter arvalis TaxID=912552 RepID=A0A840I829_9ACTN|nr:VOC family protein [Conexibacter arvalis]MBB4660431.1 hypothetical protein [Conexibacter arvalis]